MPSIQLYPDGSLGKGDPNIMGRPCGWGIVAIHNDQIVEIYDGIVANRNVKDEAEIFAFLASLKYALEQGFAVEQMTFHVDHDDVAYAQTRLHPDNYYQAEWKENFRNRLKRCIKAIGYDESFYESAMEAFSWSRFDKVKSGSRGSESRVGSCVYNHRADYLAKLGVKKAAGIFQEPKKFDNWLKRGFEYWIDNHSVMKFWIPPFVEDVYSRKNQFGRTFREVVENQ